MSRFIVKYTPESQRLIRHLPPRVKPHIRALIDKIVREPELGKPLGRELSGFYAAKHNHYRVIYGINKKKKAVIITYVGLRKEIYRMFALLLKKRGM